MVKLVACDVDGTLLQDGRLRLTEKQVGLIRACEKAGIRFAVASGRQYPSLRGLFTPLKDEILYVAENGALVMQDDHRLFSRSVPRALGCEIMEAIQRNPQHEVVLNTERTCYVRPKNYDVVQDLLFGLGNTVTVPRSLSQVDEEWLKISAFLPEGGAQEAYPYYAERFGERLYVAVAGSQWVDFGVASKGTAVRFLQQHLGIAKEEVLSMGDNGNDVEMFLASGASYAMRSAAPAVRARSTGVADSVEEVLEKALASQ